MPIVFIIIAILVCAAALVVLRVKKPKGGEQKRDFKRGGLSSLRFQQKAVAAGFTLQEAATLLDLALSARSLIENPMAVLWSYKYLDIVIKSAIQKFHADGQEQDPAGQEFLGKLLDRRKQIMVQKINARQYLSKSKDIPVGQEVRVVLTGVGVFVTKVAAHNLHFAVLSPVVLDLPPNFSWDGREVMIFFRKRSDGEYSFNTTVIREIEDDKTGDFVLLLHHQEALYRIQKRRSVRVPINREAHVYPVGEGTEKNFAESKPCVLHDISDDGCSIIMEGKMNMPHAVIVQFMLYNQLISINGECRSVQYNRTKNVSLLHIWANSIPRATKNSILTMMFGLVNESAESPAAVEPAKDGDHIEPGNQRDAALQLPHENGPEEMMPGNPSKNLQ